MRKTATLSLLACAILMLASVAAWPATEDPMSKLVSLEVQSGARFGGVIRDLMKVAPLNYSIDLDLADLPCPEFFFREVPLKAALDTLMTMVGGVIRIDGDILLISNSPDSSVMRQWKKHIKNVDITDVDTVTALRDMFEDSGINYSIDPTVGGTVSLRLTGVPFATALAKMTQKAGLTYHLDGRGGVEIAPMAAEGLGNKVVNLQLKDMPLPDALEKLFGGTGLSYTVDPGLSQLKVTAILKDVPFEVALKTVVKAAGAVWRLDGKVYIIAPKQAATTGGEVMRGRVESRILVLRNLNVSDVLFLFTQQGIRANDLGGGKLIVSGTNPMDLDRAVAQVRELDEQSASSRIVHITISVTEDNPAKSKYPIESEAKLSTPEGQHSWMAISRTDPGQNAAKSKAEIKRTLSVSVTPTIKDDGLILLKLEVGYTSDLVGQQAQSLSTQRLLDPGVPTVIGRLSVRDEDTKQLHKLTITATAAVGTGAVRTPTRAKPSAPPKPKSPAKRPVH